MVNGNENDGGAADAERQLELDALDDGADALTVLQDRLGRAQAARDLALHELRAVMSDDDALAKYGIDTSQI